MNHIIRNIDDKLLTEYGFRFDGSYWINDKVPFRLSKNSDNSYSVQLENLPKGAKTPPPITKNSELVNLILAFAQSYVDSKIKGEKFLSNKIKLTKIAELLSEYAKFDNNIRLRLVAGPNGMGLVPDNEYTHTLLSGLECQFDVKYLDKDGIKNAIIYYNPECICNEFLKELLNTDRIFEVNYIKDNELIPFFGVGMRKLDNNV